MRDRRRDPRGRLLPMTDPVEELIVELTEPTAIGYCPECGCRSVERIGGEWCPRCLGWLVESLIAGYRRTRRVRPQS